MHRIARFVFAFAGFSAAAAAQAATVTVNVLNFRYSPNSVTINAGDTVRWVNNSGFHDVRADDSSFSNSAANSFVFERTFTSAGTTRYHCSIHSAPGLDIDSAMNGRIIVQAAPAFAINQGIGGAWFEPATSGQGFLIDVEPASRFIFVAWFTYVAPTPAGAKVGVPEHRWLSAQGTYTGGTATNIGIFQTAGGRFDTPPAPGQVTTTQVGTMTLTFSSCTAGSIEYTLNEGLTGTIPIQRVIAGTETLCQMLSAGAAE